MRHATLNPVGYWVACRYREGAATHSNSSETSN